MDNYNIDGHKLNHHVTRVSEWLEGKNSYPIYMEISPTGACNHRCVFCGLDFMEYQARSLKTSLLKERISELAHLGLKSIMYAGEGEPLIHKDIVEIIRHTKETGIDVALTTNAVLLTRKVSQEILGSLEWIKASINAGSEETYMEIHKAKPGDFGKVLENLSDAKKIKDAHNYGCAIGTQMLLLPENMEQATELAKLVAEAGADYLVIKPYSQHPQSHTRKYENTTYTKDALELARRLKAYNTESFTVIFRENALERSEVSEKQYSSCLALPFWSYIDAGGCVWGCSVFLEDERFFYGNIYKNRFSEIWEGERRAKSMEWVLNEMDISKCRVNCRMEPINDFLWSLKKPPPHINFI